jgi:Sigma-70, region 4/HB1, ASXL, restriction endonuclease HTH domain
MAKTTKTPQVKLSFNSKKTTKKILDDLSERMKVVIEERFGLESGVRKTLDSIGQRYGITRERVRQIESSALSLIKKSKNYEEMQLIFTELKTLIDEMGGVVQEDNLFDIVYPHDSVMQNHLFFYLTLGDSFTRVREDDHLHNMWVTDPKVVDNVRSVLKSVAGTLEDQQLYDEAEIVNRIVTHSDVQHLPENRRGPEHVRNWIRSSKLFGTNPLGHWGLASSYNISTRGVRDYAYLVLHQHGSPMHFREIAQAISDKFEKPVHVATTHNTLISDGRFVLIGRGLYGLKEWGYMAGTARDVIMRVMKKAGKPLQRHEIIDLVSKERHLKENTILVNLHNAQYFKKDDRGYYSLVNPDAVPDEN